MINEKKCQNQQKKDGVTIKKIRKINRTPVYDISVKEAEHYILENGIVTHNTGSYYSSDNIWVIGRQQDKDKDKSINGYHFIINIEKSRFVKEKSKIPISVSYDKGILRWSGLLDLAMEAGIIGQPKKGFYSLMDETTQKPAESPAWKEDQILENSDFWKEILSTEYFYDFIKNKYSLGEIKILEDEING